MTKTALVTGGGRGIGSGIVESLVRESWNVAFCGRAPLERYADRLTALREKYPAVRIEYYTFDVSNTSEAPNLLSRVLNDFGSLNALVNNAGVAPEVRADLLEMTEASFDRVMSINLRGPFFLTQRIANYMLEQKKIDPDFSAAIVDIGSISATVVSVNRGEYCFSKAGVAMMTQLFAARLGAAGIPVYELRPGVVHSDMTSVVTEKYSKLIAGGLTVQPRWGEPEDVGRAVVMLLRGDLAYSTGQVIGIDGGMQINRL